MGDGADVARPQPFKVEVPKGTDPALAQQLRGIEQNFRTLFIDAANLSVTPDVGGSIEIASDNTIQLDNDEVSPGATEYYGTDASGIKGYYGLVTSEWDTVIVKATDQDVENSTTLVDDTELQFPVTAASLWLIELLLLYSASDATRDITVATAVSAGTMSGAYTVNGLGAASTPIITPVGMAEVAASVQTDLGTVAAQAQRPARFIGVWLFSSAGTFKIQFAQRSASIGTNSRIEAGSILRGERLI